MTRESLYLFKTGSLLRFFLGRKASYAGISQTSCKQLLLSQKCFDFLSIKVFNLALVFDMLTRLKDMGVYSGMTC
jgi:hypothetical protein